EYFAYIHAQDLNLSLLPECMHEISRIGAIIGRYLARRLELEHPEENLLSFLSGVIFMAPPEKRHGSVADTRQVCVFTDSSLDRSPSGTGMSGRLAIHHFKGEITLGEPLIAEGI